MKPCIVFCRTLFILFFVASSNLWGMHHDDAAKLKRSLTDLAGNLGELKIKNENLLTKLEVLKGRLEGKDFPEATQEAEVLAKTELEKYVNIATIENFSKFCKFISESTMPLAKLRLVIQKVLANHEMFIINSFDTLIEIYNGKPTVAGETFVDLQNQTFSNLEKIIKKALFTTAQVEQIKEKCQNYYNFLMDKYKNYNSFDTDPLNVADDFNADLFDKFSIEDSFDVSLADKYSEFYPQLALLLKYDKAKQQQELEKGFNIALAILGSENYIVTPYLLNKVNYLTSFLRYIINSEFKTKEDIVKVLVPKLSGRTNGLICAYVLFDNRYIEKSFWKFAVGALLWLIGQRPIYFQVSKNKYGEGSDRAKEDQTFERLGKHCMRKLVEFIWNLDSTELGVVLPVVNFRCTQYLGSNVEPQFESVRIGADADDLKDMQFTRQYTDLGVELKHELLTLAAVKQICSIEIKIIQSAKPKDSGNLDRATGCAASQIPPTLKTKVASSVISDLKFYKALYEEAKKNFSSDIIDVISKDILYGKNTASGINIFQYFIYYNEKKLSNKVLIESLTENDKKILWYLFGVATYLLRSKSTLQNKLIKGALERDRLVVLIRFVGSIMNMVLAGKTLVPDGAFAADFNVEFNSIKDVIPNHTMWSYDNYNLLLAYIIFEGKIVDIDESLFKKSVRSIFFDIGMGAKSHILISAYAALKNNIKNGSYDDKPNIIEWIKAVCAEDFSKESKINNARLNELKGIVGIEQIVK